ncbi:MAG: D-alanyl-D-alanine carboxypeptidase [Rhodobacteraceae bacterium HLUCCA08]|nr:MAG: D-alanyl-D-alanine carboxypeptidase [Rhodobacteraceae bacterium HLUCCA08]
MAHPVFSGLFLFGFLLLAALTPIAGRTAPYAAMVMDARTGEVLHSRNADTPLHPASLTKMMTLYIAFQAVERGEIGLDTMVTITPHAANEPPSKIGLQPGQTIRFRYLLRAAAIKSANDAATAIGIALEGNEAAFARRMTATAQAMGMSRTRFLNAHGLTEAGHQSTARDMTILGRHLIYDFPQYYNLFSRRTADAGITTVANTNRLFLNGYAGADGIKTGYTRAAGFNLTASARRGQERIIATVFGMSSSPARADRIVELMNMGFARAPNTARIDPPTPPAFVSSAPADPAAPGSTGKTIRVNGLVTRSLRPQARPVDDPAPEVLLVDADMIDDVVTEVLAAATQTTEAPLAPAATVSPPPVRPTDLILASTEAEPAAQGSADVEAAVTEVTTAQVQVTPPAEPDVVTRLSTSGGRHWGISIGRYPSQYQAERVLLQVALNEMSTLDGSLRRVNQSPQGFDANFMGLTRETAELACARLQARGTTCFMIGPS